MVDNIWTEFAASYDRVIPELHCYQRMLEKILIHTARCAQVIDAGCGTGIVSEALVQRGQHVSGFDNNPGMLAAAQARHAAMAPDAQARWALGEGDAMAYPPGVPTDADAVVLNNVLFYCPDADAALDQAAAHVGDAGIFVATGPRHRPDGMKVFQHELQAWQAEGRDVERLQADVQHHLSLMKRLTMGADEMVTFFEPDALVDAMRSRGFSTVLEASGDDYYGENFFVAVRKA